MGKFHPISDDERFMALACKLALRGKGKTSPNPMVGAVLVKEGHIIGTGYHKKSGSLHAEIVAIENAESKIDGATLYVNLEPCTHYGKTPPCVDRIIKEKIQRVVIGSKDPNPQVNGKSIEILEAHNIKVTYNILQEQCRVLNESFFKYMETGKPFITLKAAASLDGKIACFTGKSQWISCAASRKKAHRARNLSDAILVGIGTVLNDNPQLTVRGIPQAKKPLRVVMDSKLQIPLTSKILQPEASTLLATTTAAPLEKIAQLESRGISVKAFSPDQKGRIPFSSLMRYLGENDIMHLLIEGGSQIYTTALESRETDKVMLFLAPLLLGGTEAPSLFAGKGVKSPDRGYALDNFTFRKSDQDILLEGYLSWPKT